MSKKTATKRIPAKPARQPSTLTTWLKPNASRVQEAASNAGKRVFEEMVSYPDKDQLEVDEAKSVIRNAKIIGVNGKNAGREYPQKVLEAHQKLYEGANVNINHPKEGDKTRDYYERFGWIENVHTIPGKEGLYGDVRYNPKHKNAPDIIWWAKNHSESFGLSPDHYISEISDGQGGNRVTAIHKVHAVDIVADPSTTNGLHEAEQTMPDPMLDPNAAPAGDPDAGGSDTEHLRNACIKCVEDGIAAIDDNDQLRKMHMKLEKLFGNGGAAEEEEPEAPAAETTPAEEGEETPEEKEKKEEMKKEEESLRRSDNAEIKKLMKLFDAKSVREAALQDQVAALKSQQSKAEQAAKDRETLETRREEARKRCQEAQLPEFTYDPSKRPAHVNDPKQIENLQRIARTFVDDLANSTKEVQESLILEKKALVGAVTPSQIEVVSIAREEVERVPGRTQEAQNKEAPPAADLQKAWMEKHGR